jgi:putative phosphonate metabolism protein
MSENGPRYAIYFAPDAASPLWQFGCSVLGTDAETGGDVPFAPTLESLWPDWAALTSEPRRYGFHATLKAPFRLRDGIGKTDLIDAVSRFAADQKRVELSGLRMATIGRFVALVPVGDVSRLQALAARVVDTFEHLRAPLSDADRARRLKSPLTRAQTYYLDKYGYPYVHDEFRFHMTLTGGLAKETLPAVQTQLAELFTAAVPEGAVTVGGLAVFRQDHSGARFRIVARVPLL